jgi:murein DD-endopeptidase MepM/ murein hydrolase activator NlpD
MRTTFIWAAARWYALSSAIGLTLFGNSLMAVRADSPPRKGYGITKTRLYPIYPREYSCSPLTSLYASYRDVDGSRRSEPHSGVDGGRLGEAVLAPADGTVEAVWKANWGWGGEGALLIRHSRGDLNLRTGRPFYYSEFNHLKYRDVRHLKTGQRVKRGQPIGIVDRPGGKARYLPEVHWEVYEVTNDETIEWSVGDYGTRYWTNEASRLIDPLYLLSRNAAPRSGRGVRLVPFDASIDYSQFRGFTYILPCRRKLDKP